MRISRQTFEYILSHVHDDLLREVLVEEPISPAERLAIALYKFGRGEYNYTISEMCGRGESTVAEIIVEVAGVIVRKLCSIPEFSRIGRETDAGNERPLAIS